MTRLAEYMNAERATLFLHDATEKALWSVAAAGEKVDRISISDHQGIAGSVMQKGETINIADAYTDPRFFPEVDKTTGFRTRSILCQPVIDYQGVRIGVIQLLNKKSGAFDAHDERMLDALASQSAIAIENAQLYEKISGLRKNEQALTRELEQSHKKLQQAYIEIENRNASLSSRLDGRSWMKRMSLLLVLLCGGTGLWWVGAEKIVNYQAVWMDIENNAQPAAPDKDHDTNVVTTRPVTEWLYLNGNIRPLRWVKISSPLDSVVSELNFDYGDRVNRGQRLAVLDTLKQQLQLREATSQYIAALEEMERISNWSTSLEVLAAQRELATAKEVLGRTRRQLEHSRDLYGKGIIARGELEENEVSVNDRKLAVVSATDRLHGILEQGAETKLKIARLALENAEQRLRNIEAAIERAVIYSPANGIIFPAAGANAASPGTTRQVQPGYDTSRNTTLFEIADMQGIAIDVDVTESQVLKLQIGQKAVVSINALSDIELDGKIDMIAERARTETASGSSSKFRVRVVVPEIDTRTRNMLRIGMSSAARVMVYHNPDAVIVDFESLYVEEDEYYVKVVSADGEVEKRAVELGPTQVDGVEITTGLESGEKSLTTRL